MAFYPTRLFGKPAPNSQRIMLPAVSDVVTVFLVGVLASAAIGSPQINVTYPVSGVAATPNVGASTVAVSFAFSGVAANPAIGTGSVSATITSSGVTATPAIGVFTFNTETPLNGVQSAAAIGSGAFSVAHDLMGVLGSAAIGVGSFDADMAISGVVAGASVGALEIDVATLLAGVAADPHIGSGIVNTGADEIVDLTGVSANSQVGTGTVEIQSVRRRRHAYGAGPRPRYTPPQKIEIQAPDFFVGQRGISARPKIGQGVIDADLELQSQQKLIVLDANAIFDAAFPLGSAPLTVISVGEGTVRPITDLLDEELITLLEG